MSPPPGTAAARERNGHDAAVDPLREGLALLDDRPSPFASVVFQQELVEVLVGAGRNDEAAEVFTELTAFWRKAKATWYLGRLEGWARELGLAVQPA